MNQSPFPSPLTAQAFYVLLCLVRGDRHPYRIGAVAYNDSLGSVKMPNGTLYPLLERLSSESLIEIGSMGPTNGTGKVVIHYTITHHGVLRLKEELARMEHAVEIGRAAGPFEDTRPLDIQRLATLDD
jgi:DNA-binding PadR family transcriptional regulator